MPPFSGQFWVAALATTTTPRPGAPADAVADSSGLPTPIVVAIIAVLGVLVTAGVQLWLGHRTVGNLRRSAEAALKQAENARISADAARKSAEAAESSVGVNRDTAAGVARRAEADSLAHRYQVAAEQLGHADATVRLAGTYSMARLADDWPEQRQACVDVLCAYLRLPERTLEQPPGMIAGPAPSPDPADLEVRRTVITLIHAHLTGTSDISWSDLHFNFDRAVLRDLDLSQSIFNEPLSMKGAVLHGHCTFISSTLAGGGSAQSVTVTKGSQLNLNALRLGSDLDLGRLLIEAGAEVWIRHLCFFPRPGLTGELTLVGLRCHGMLRLMISADSTEGEIYLVRAAVAGGGYLSVHLGSSNQHRDQGAQAIRVAPVILHLEMIRADDGGTVRIGEPLRDRAGAITASPKATVEVGPERGPFIPRRR